MWDDEVSIRKGAEECQTDPRYSLLEKKGATDDPVGGSAT